MAGRRTATVPIHREGRDRGGVFTLTEMPAVQATEWFIRAMQLLARSGADVPSNIMHLGAAGFVTMGIGTVLTGLGKAPWHEVKPLLDELLGCVTSYQPPGAVAAQTRWDVIKGQIEEPATILQLHEEVVSLHLGFSLAARLSNYRDLAARMMAALSPNTETSTEQSPLSSPPA
ncbi:MAG: hypothetical protein P4L90_26115 [Rhodopila sp.]|nr:hypothetical protein [Rhodopila sp.]